MKRRGFILIAVLIVVGCAVLVATGIVFLVRGEVAGTSNAVETLRLRNAAWSGVQAVASRLASQRDRVLAGATPTIDSVITLWETSDEIATARLLGVDADGARLVAEAGRIDVRTTSSEELVATGAVHDDLAKRAIAARDALGGGALQPESLLAIGADALSPEDLYGPLDGVRLGLDEDADVKSGDALERLIGGGAPRGLADLLTGFAEDPQLTSAGAPRIALLGEWTDEKRRALDAALGAGAAALLEIASKNSADYASLFAVWQKKNPEPRTWALFLDATTPDDREALLGRLDIMHASPAALRSLPGIDSDRAARIVRERDAIPEDAKRTPVWLMDRGIVNAEEFAALIARVTTRSVFWRARIAVSVSAPSNVEANESADADDINGRIAVLDVVIDLSAAMPRIAMLRDVSSLETAAQLVGELPPRPERPERDDRFDERVASDELPSEPVAPPPMPDEIPAATRLEERDSSAAPTQPSIERSAGRWRKTRGSAE